MVPYMMLFLVVFCCSLLFVCEICLVEGENTMDIYPLEFSLQNRVPHAQIWILWQINREESNGHIEERSKHGEQWQK